MKFWETHTQLRVWLIVISFVLGVVCIYSGLTLGGQLLGVAIMVVGLGLLLTALWLYNSPFADKKK